MMKSKLYTFLFACCLLFGASSLSAQLLINGDMESWNGDVPDGWTTIESGITLAQETNIVQEGNASASVNVTTATQGDTDFRQTINVVAGTSYEVSFWVYHTEGGVRARMYVETFQDYTLPELTNQWQELTMTYEATESGEIEVGLRFYDVAANFDGEEIVYVDNYSFSPVIVTEPAIVITAPSEGAILTSGDTEVAFVVQNFMVGNPGDPGVEGHLRFSLNGMATEYFNTDPIALTDLDNGEYQAVLELTDDNGTSLNPMATDTVNFTVAIPTLIEVATIADLRAGTQGESYLLTGEAILTYQQTFRNQKYLQDGTAGILIDDNDGVITSTYMVNDGITGMSGTLGEFGGMLQFVPLTDPGAASSSGNTVASQTITLLDLVNDFEAYEAELVTINDVSFADAGGTFENGTVYSISDPSSMYDFRTTFFNVDYIGTEIMDNVSVTGIPNSRFDGDYLSARNLADFDFSSSVRDLSVTSFAIMPNPNRGQFSLQNEGLAGDYQLSIFDVLGQMVQTQKINLQSNEQSLIDVATTTPGLYFVQLKHLTQEYEHTLRMIIE